MSNLITSILAFVSTNIDDIFLLMLFFGSKRFTASTIFAGQCLGIAALVIGSLLLSYVGELFDQRYIGLLGLFPIYLALRDIIQHFRRQDDDDDNDNDNVPLTGGGVLAIAGVTIANGGDNVGVYIPLFTIMSDGEKLQLAFVFIAMTYLWCIAGQYLAARPLIAKHLERYGHIVMPVVLFALGVFIIIESNTFSLL